ncbi:hypothetical protein ACRCUN_08475 [Mycobacterium sp. LTG2003]
MQSPIGGSTSAEALVTHAHKLLANCGVSISPSKVSRMVREYKRRVEKNGFPFEAFLVNTVQLTAEQRRQMLANPDIARVISYSDPTGETAANNVDRGTRRRPSHVDRPAITVEELVPDPVELQDITVMASVSDELFEEALAEAEAEGDLSRANVVRKCKAKVSR